MSRCVLILSSVIAISGLGGHAFGSFKQRDGMHMWLRDALPRHLTGDDNRPLARVMTYGYDTRLSGHSNFQNLDDLGRSFNGSILALVNGSNCRPIIILAHSLGGLVVKQASLLKEITMQYTYKLTVPYHSIEGHG